MLGMMDCAGLFYVPFWISAQPHSIVLRPEFWPDSSFTWATGLSSAIYYLPFFTPVELFSRATTISIEIFQINKSSM